MRNSSRAILVFRYGTLGDTLVALPALAALRRSFPERRLHYMTAAVPAERMISPKEVLRPTGLVDGFLEYRAGDGLCANLRRVRDYVRRRGVDTLMYLPQPERALAQVVRDKVFFASCGIRNLIGFEEALANVRRRVGRSPRRQPCEADRLLSLVARDGAEPPPKSAIPLGVSACEREKIDRLWMSRSLADHEVVIAVCPGGKHAGKRWPEERYLEVGSSLLASFDIALAVVGGPADRERARYLCESWGRGAHDLCGDLSIWECAELLARCDLYLGNDTGTMHLAALVGTRCLALFSYHNLPGTWFPRGGRHTVLQKRVSCGPCLSEGCSRGDPVCLKAISVAEVEEAARTMLLEERRPCVASLESVAV